MELLPEIIKNNITINSVTGTYGNFAPDFFIAFGYGRGYTIPVFVKEQDGSYTVTLHDSASEQSFFNLANGKYKIGLFTHTPAVSTGQQIICLFKDGTSGSRVQLTLNQNSYQDFSAGFTVTTGKVNVSIPSHSANSPTFACGWKIE